MSRLRVGIETQFAVGTATGLGVYASGLVEALRGRDEIDVVELSDPRHDVWRFDRRVLWDQVHAPSLAARSGAGVIHFTGGTLPMFLRARRVLTLHDLVWMRKANRGRPYVRWYFGALQPSLARRADAIVADTDAAADDIAEGLDVSRERVSVGGVGVERAFFDLRRAPDAAPFALAVGTIEERKDLATAVRALARVRDLKLMAVGPFTPYVDEVRKAASSCGVADRVEIRGFVDRRTLLDLYSRAAMLVFPSRYEGFGLPPLQALACGLPVAAARIAPVLEVLGECAWYAEPGDDVGLARAIETILSGGEEIAARTAQGRVRAATHTWDRVAERLTHVYRQVAAL